MQNNQQQRSVNAEPDRKSRGNYLRDSLMLFLAVFCGFLAEDFREQKNEEKATLEYIKALSEDLSRDSLQLAQISEHHASILSKLDELQTEITRLSPVADSRPVYRLLSYASGFPDFVPNDGTFEQMKHIGALRNVKEKDIIDGLLAYHSNVGRLRINEAITNQALIEMDKLTEHFDLVRLQSADSLGIIPLPDGSPRIRNILYSYVLNWELYMVGLQANRNHIAEFGIKLQKVIREHYPNL
ncbi:MAG TPA: hypothetical protein PK509_07015 [Catalimonadaceae bacterium]|nr:hypothetical protein [Catalimonadaceae bacterium]